MKKNTPSFDELPEDLVDVYGATVYVVSAVPDSDGTFTVDMVEHSVLTFLTRFDIVDLPGASFEGVTINFPSIGAPIPAVSAWGVAITALLALAYGSLLFRRRPAANR